jgi:hypothetical protein
MATIDPAGNASAALYTPAARVEAPAQSSATEIQRPVVESTEARPPLTSVSNESTDEGLSSTLGRFIDTRA